MSQLAYQNTSPDKIAVALAELNPFTNEEVDASSVSRSTNGNFIIVLPGAQQITTTQKLVESLTGIHPGRFFVLCVDDSFANIQCQVALQCHISSADNKVCSEVIRLSGNTKQLSALTSILRAHVCAGVSTELLVVASSAGLEPLELIASVAGLADSFYFDSRKLCVEALARLLSLKGTLVDMSWLSSAAWRAQLKELFERPALLDILRQTEKVQIVEGSHPGVSPGHLLTYWLIRCLRSTNLQTPVLHVVQEGAGLQRIQFLAASGEPLLQMKREGLQILCEASPGIQLSRPLDVQDNVELIEKYFLIGESLLNYRTALCGALEFFSAKEQRK